MGAQLLQTESHSQFTNPQNLHSSLLRIFSSTFLSFVVIMDVVTRMVAEKSVVIFSKNSCCMSHSIKTLITSFGANPTVYELDEMPNGKQIEAALLQLGCCPSVPAVFIGQQFIGGAKEVMRVQVRHELPQLLMRAGAIWV